MVLAAAKSAGDWSTKGPNLVLDVCWLLRKVQFLEEEEEDEEGT